LGAPSLSPLSAWLGFSVLEASPLFFTFTRSAAFYPLAVCQATFDPQASYAFLVIVLSSRSEHAPTRLGSFEMTFQGVTLHLFFNQILLIRHLLVFVLSRL